MSKNSDNDEPPKVISELNGFKYGDFVKVKNGIKDPDDDTLSMDNWCGRIVEICDDGVAEIKWDSITIRGMNIKNIKKYEKEGLGWGSMYLGLNEIEKATPRDNEDDADDEMSKIQWKYFRKEYFPEGYD